MLESLTGNVFEYIKLTEEEQKSRKILGRLKGIIADFKNPTRNGRKYSEKLWENVFNNPIMQEKIKNRCCFGELSHPENRTEIDPEKIAICLAETPKKGKDGKLYGIFDIIDTPSGKILKTLCDYGSTLAISSRGQGDIITDFEGNESVDPDTYECECFDIVLVPGVESARLAYVNEGLETRKPNQVKKALLECLDTANEEDKKVMQKTLEDLNIDLTEPAEMNEEKLDRPEDEEISFEEYKKEGLEFAELVKKEFTPEQAKETFYDEYEFDRHMPDDEIEQAIYDALKAKMHELAEELEAEKEQEEEEVEEYDPSWDGGDEIAQYIEDRDLTYKDIRDMGEYERVNLAQDFVDDVLEGRGETFDGLNAIDFYLETRNPDSLEDPDESKKEDEESEKKEPEEENLEEEAEAKEEEVIEIENDDLGAELPKVDEECIDESRADTEENAIKEELEQSEEAVDDGKEELLKSLQETLKNNLALEHSNKELQEQLAVSDAKVSELIEENNRFKKAITRLSAMSKSNKTLKEDLAELEKALNEKDTIIEEQKGRISRLAEARKQDVSESLTLNESVTNKTNEVNTLTENLNTAKAEVVKLTEMLESERKNSENSLQQLRESVSKETTLKEAYKKLANKAVNKYIDIKANMLGLTAMDIKRKLGESYTLTDVDEVCEDLKAYQVNVSKLPFNVGSKIGIKVNEGTKTSSMRHNSIASLDDDVDESLMKLANLK